MAQEFAADLIKLHPLSKLKGISVNEKSLKVLPDLTQENVASNLAEAIEKLLSPEEGLADNKRWQSSSMHIFASGAILENLIK